MTVGIRLSIVLPLLVAAACAKQGAIETPPQLPNPASVYCEQQGGRLEIVETMAGQQGICVLASGIRCDEWAYFRGECPSPSVTSVQLESLYMSRGVDLTTDRRLARSVSLSLSGSSSDELQGTLSLDPNACGLTEFGDKDVCTLIGFFGIHVELDRLRLEDPSGLMRKIYSVSGEGLPRDLRMVVQGELAEGELERAYLKLGTELVPLYLGEQR